MVARHVQSRKGHVGRSNLKRHDIVSKGGERQWHHGKEHHDGAVHGPEAVVKVVGNSIPDQLLGLRVEHRRSHVPHDGMQQVTDHRNGLARVGNRPAHHGNEEKSQEHEEK